MSNESSQQMVVREARLFADEVLRPRAGDFDREEFLPRDIIDELAKRKYLLASLPEADGGLGLDPVYYGFLTEEIGKACCSTRGLITVQSSLIGETLMRWGKKEQKAKWLLPLSNGEKIGAFALTEPGVGTDAKGVQTSYVKRGKEYVLNGTKKWTSFGELADFFIVIAACRTEITAFIVERDRSGITISHQKGLLANRASHLSEIEFQNVTIPEENIIGKPGSGFTFIASTALDHGRYSIAWAGVAIAQEALDSMAKYARERKAFGRKIGEFQLIQMMIGNAVTKTHAARALCIKVGEMRSRGDSNATIETTIAKYFTSQIACEVTTDAVQVHGGNGCSNNYPVERLFREAKVLEIIEGTSQIQQLIIAKYGLRKYGKSSHY
ncbi:MAG: acyl-CoA dehydrogenase [Candidatus Scalindua sp. AMX11]|nr:MAG: acyl-CoA dehydrogenase [Candidatus Scalindua sp.]NOG85561.1 acyl-CoA dehydrogenase [Planctomycetota bacterium]RZV90190.1 MAG: acyl-CoA dehydrogenase [Candidatus Scalindua sp. SCAELEC01]TDE64974.1 MAG: acyl-CoA dehydrogenase [Candidatus Scalindua sp. AMX11]GJQ59590.1 MAG: acyl-CoA dehydrogenase [Candidatus Scalindua sp.]